MNLKIAVLLLMTIVLFSGCNTEIQPEKEFTHDNNSDSSAAPLALPNNATDDPSPSNDFLDTSPTLEFDILGKYICSSPSFAVTEQIIQKSQFRAIS